MNINDIKKGLLNFIEADDDFAIMLDGPWGSGKTYFIKNYFSNELKNINMTYFSIYGYDSLSNLTKELTNFLVINNFGFDIEGNKSNTESFNTIKDNLTNLSEKIPGLSLLSDITSDYIKRNRLININKPAVLVIDDIERISRNINISDFLGYILTNIIEKYGYRVIIVGDSKKIDNDENFDVIKEKSISRILKFSHDRDIFCTDFFKKSSVKYLKDDSDFINRRIINYEKHNSTNINLRTIEFIISTFSIIENSLNKDQEFLSQNQLIQFKIKRSAFLNLFVFSNEYRNNNLNENNLSEIDNLLYRKYIYMKIFSKEYDESSKIIKDYHNDDSFNNNIIYTKEIYQVILEGVFNANDFTKNWLKLFKTNKIDSDIQKLKQFRYMNETEFKSLQENIIDDVSTEHIEPMKLIAIINDFLWMKKEDLLLIENPDIKEYIDKFKTSIETVDIPDEIDYINQINQYKYINQNNEIYKEINDILKTAREKETAIKTKKYIESIFSNNQYFINPLEFRGNIFKEQLVKDKVIKEHQYIKLDLYLQDYYLRYDNSKDFHSKEKDDIEELLRLTKEQLMENKINKIEKYNIKELIETLNKVINKLT